MVSLYCLNTSLKNSIANPLDCLVDFCSSEQLLDVKVSHDEFPLLLDSIVAKDYIEEVSLVSTCNRFEIYCVANSNLNEAQLDELQQVVKSINSSRVKLNVLKGPDAELNFYRTFCGLNSGLIGEAEIAQQTEIAFRQSLAMGYLKTEGAKLLTKAKELRKIIDTQFFVDQVSYCSVAVTEAIKKLNFEVDQSKKLAVLGSGSTALESCKALVNLGFSPEQILLIHRISSSSSQIKAFCDLPELHGMSFMRSKYGYHADKAIRRIATMDLTVFGIDSRLPVMNLDKYFSTKVIDFNSKTSCTFSLDFNQKDFISAADIEVLVREYNESRLNSQNFSSSIQAAESLIGKEARQGLLV